eukprot:GHVU01043943.1.p2 GENE.GHVU01043943.1~~GHVU01043943.1.p2  ORF type:complete len:117 (-),score=5.33 GHVU01043943.1:143-493(-)
MLSTLMCGFSYGYQNVPALAFVGSWMELAGGGGGGSKLLTLDLLGAPGVAATRNAHRRVYKLSDCIMATDADNNWVTSMHACQLTLRTMRKHLDEFGVDATLRDTDMLPTTAPGHL